MSKYFEFDTKAKVLSGDKALSRVPYELSIRGKERPFVMSDKGLWGLGVTKSAIKSMKLENYTLFTDIPVDSSTETVNNATIAYKANNCDCVIAIGGGSVIDTAKGVILSIVSGQSDIEKIEGADAIKKENSSLFIAVPTTAGTGSEMTSVAVIKSAIKASKLEYISTFILPDISVIDPSMTVSLPKKTTASTAIDALTHCIEAYTCLMKNPISDAYAICAIKLIIGNLFKAIENGKDEEARWNLANAAMLAGAAFSNSMVGAVHSIGHALGAVCHVAHGDAMAILLPSVLKLNLEKCDSLYGELLCFVNEERFIKTSVQDRGKVFIEEIEKLLSMLHEKAELPVRLSQTGKVEEANFEEIALKAMADGSNIVNPVALTNERILKVLKEAF